MKHKTLILTFLFLFFLGAVFFYLVKSKNKEIIYDTAVVKSGKIIQTVSEVGSVEPAKDIDLSFVNSGIIKNIFVDVGDKVKKGQILAELDYDALLIKKREAELNIEIAQENLSKLLAGASKEKVAVYKANLKQAETAYKTAENELEKVRNELSKNLAQAQKTYNDLKFHTEDDITIYEQAIESAQDNLDNTKLIYGKYIQDYKTSTISTVNDKIAIINNALDAVDVIKNDDDIKDVFSVKDNSYKILLENYQNEAEKSLSALNAFFTQIKSSQANNEDYQNLLDKALESANLSFSVLKNCFSALENTQTSSSYSETSLEADKSTVSAQQTLIATAISSLQTLKQNLNSAIINYNTNVSSAENKLKEAQVAYDNAFLKAKDALDLAKANREKTLAGYETKLKSAKENYNVAKAKLDEILAPADKHDLALAQSKVEQSKANLEAINKNISDSIIKAPIDGVVSKVNYEEGEKVGAGTNVITILINSDYDIEVLISESDIEKVKKKQDANITLDAFGDDLVFTGKVYFIEPAQTEVQDVIYYKVDIVFNSEGKNIKPGMTANVDIITAQKDNVLIVPMRAIIEKNKKKYVRLLQGKTYKEQEIKTGIYGDDSLVEVVSGLKKGDLVVLRIQEK